MMNYSDIEIERSVLGELMAFAEHRPKIILLSADDFTAEEHGRMFTAMYEQYAANGDFDFLTVANDCGDRYREEIQRCVQLAISAGLFEEHFRLLKDMSSRRRLTREVNALEWSGEISVASLQSLIEKERGKSVTDDARTQTEKSLVDFTENLNRSVGTLKTGFPTVDKVCGGIRRGTVFIVGARPSVGKTAFALNIAANQITAHDKKVMFFSLEMTSEMIWERLMAARLQIEYSKFSRNELTENDMTQVRTQAENLKTEGRFLILDEVYNVEIICNLIRENKPDLAVVDFMQIISATGKFENVRNRIDYISAMFKRTAKDVGCVILVLSQLSRAGKDAPTMSDLKESGGLEQDGDYIALLHRPYVLDKQNADVQPEDSELLLDKNKFGTVGRVKLWFDLKHQRFHELDTWHESRIDRSGSAFDGVEI
jgi:replicative DNA helicase